MGNAMQKRKHEFSATLARNFEATVMEQFIERVLAGAIENNYFLVCAKQIIL